MGVGDCGVYIVHRSLCMCMLLLYSQVARTLQCSAGSLAALKIGTEPESVGSVG